VALEEGPGSCQTNRDAALIVLGTTGVTAMARNPAVAIDRSGDPGFLARVVGPELAAADLTIISNEIPFLPDCVADDTLNNLILCSHNDYWENLALSGVDAIGLSGNHQNDFGYDAMRQSLAFYKEKKIPTYGGGVDDRGTRAPGAENHGNRLLGREPVGPVVVQERQEAQCGPKITRSARFEPDCSDIEVGRRWTWCSQRCSIRSSTRGDYQVEPIQLQVNDFQGMIDVVRMS
jgi:hypothetical protein